ncbi:MAG: hypothetical protein FWE43_02515 [Streptococcaceae bacterium]|nr:hypothetical protein [Streptococcaceae bacterium]
MNKLMKFGLGAVLGLAGATATYLGYQKMVDKMRRDLLETIREYYSDLDIKVVWIEDEMQADSTFNGGLVYLSDNEEKEITFNIDAQATEIKENESEKL